MTEVVTKKYRVAVVGTIGSRERESRVESRTRVANVSREGESRKRSREKGVAKVGRESGSRM